MAGLTFFSNYNWFINTINGLKVANETFIEALIKYNTVFGKFIFTHRDKRVLAEVKNRLGWNEKVHIIPWESLESDLYKVCSKVDVIHCGDWMQGFQEAAHLTDRCDSRPVIKSGKNSNGSTYPIITGMIHAVDTPTCEYWMMKRSQTKTLPGDVIFCSSNAGLRVMTRLADFFNVNPDILHHVPLGIEPFRKPELPDVRKTFLIPKEDKIVLYLGRVDFDRKADLRPMISSFYKVLDSGIKATLIVAGAVKDGMRDLYPQIRDESVRIVPGIDERLKHALFYAADVFVSPVDSYQETFGITLLEAMHSGTPSIVSDFSGYNELIYSGKNGYLVDTYCLNTDDLSGTLEERSRSNSQGVIVDYSQFSVYLRRLLTRDNLLFRMSSVSVRDAVKYHWRELIPKYCSRWFLATKYSGRKYLVSGKDLNIIDMCRSSYSRRSIRYMWVQLLKGQYHLPGGLGKEVLEHISDMKWHGVEGLIEKFGTKAVGGCLKHSRWTRRCVFGEVQK